MNRIAVIIVNYNGGAMLRRCLDTIEVQMVRADRVILTHNDSKDGSAEACRADFPSVEFHLLDVNLDFARANNLRGNLSNWHCRVTWCGRGWARAVSAISWCGLASGSVGTEFVA